MDEDPRKRTPRRGGFSWHPCRHPRRPNLRLRHRPRPPDPLRAGATPNLRHLGDRGCGPDCKPKCDSARDALYRLRPPGPSVGVPASVGARGRRRAFPLILDAGGVFRCGGRVPRRWHQSDGAAAEEERGRRRRKSTGTVCGYRFKVGGGS